MDQERMVVTVAHDYQCPWCWVGFFQAQKLQQEFPQISLRWVGYELLPEELGPLPDYKAHPRDPDNPTRFELFADSEGVPLRERTVGLVRTHAALEGAAFVQDRGAPECFDRYNEAVYRAFWERSEDISDLDVLGAIAHNAGVVKSEFLDAVASKAYYDQIVRFDDDAYARDVTHVPTFLFRGERCAEAPYATIREMAQRFLIWYDKKAH